MIRASIYSVRSQDFNSDDLNAGGHRLSSGVVVAMAGMRSTALAGSSYVWLGCTGLNTSYMNAFVV